MSEPATRNIRRPTAAGELRHGILNLGDTLAQSIALLSLALGVGTATSAAAIYAGGAVPWAYLVAGVGCLCLASVIVFASVAAYTLNAWALARTHASHVAIFVTLQPVVATALAIVWLGEVPAVKTGISAALIFAGLLISRPPVRSPDTLQ